MKKEMPILFSTPMVEALIAGRKTQTRRIIKSNHESGLFHVCRRVTDGQIINIESLDWDERNCEKDVVCRYGKPGDILYVRESWKLVAWDFEDGTATIQYANGDQVECLMGGDSYDEKAHEWTLQQVEKLEDKGILRQDPEDDERFEFVEGAKHPFSPSIHLPKWCSRIWVEVVDVRVERLQDISYEDAMAEGVGEQEGGWFQIPGSEICRISPIAAFNQLWKNINGAESWDANPWCWVVEFKVLSTTGKPESLCK